MIQKIAWKNIWRNKLRSVILIFSISLGIWAGLFLMSMTTGLNNQRINNAINSGLGHIQLHHPDFISENNPKFKLNDTAIIANLLTQNQNIKKWSFHTINIGMATSPTGGFGISLFGVNPKREAGVTSISSKIITGSYLNSSRKNQIVIGEKLAKKLKVKVNNKIIITFQDHNDNILSSAFKICGIYKTSSSRFDEVNVYITDEEIKNLVGGDAGINEVIILTNNIQKVAETTNTLTNQLRDLKVRSWDEISPELGYANEIMTIGLSIFILIIILAMSFGIINTMLMAVLERQKELGILMSIGLNKFKIFVMILSETFFISLIGGPAGIISAYITINYFSKVGIDLSSVGSGLDSLGIGSVIYTQLDNNMYIIITISILLTAIIASVYPSIRAIRLKVVEVIRQN